MDTTSNETNRGAKGLDGDAPFVKHTCVKPKAAAGVNNSVPKSLKCQAKQPQSPVKRNVHALSAAEVVFRGVSRNSSTDSFEFDSADTSWADDVINEKDPGQLSSKTKSIVQINKTKLDEDESDWFTEISECESDFTSSASQRRKFAEKVKRKTIKKSTRRGEQNGNDGTYNSETRNSPRSIRKDLKQLEPQLRTSVKGSSHVLSEPAGKSGESSFLCSTDTITSRKQCKNNFVRAFGDSIDFDTAFNDHFGKEALSTSSENHPTGSGKKPFVRNLDDKLRAEKKEKKRGSAASFSDTRNLNRTLSKDRVDVCDEKQTINLSYHGVPSESLKESQAFYANKDGFRQRRRASIGSSASKSIREEVDGTVKPKLSIGDTIAKGRKPEMDHSRRSRRSSGSSRGSKGSRTKKRSSIGNSSAGSGGSKGKIHEAVKKRHPSNVHKATSPDSTKNRSSVVDLSQRGRRKSISNRSPSFPDGKSPRNRAQQPPSEDDRNEMGGTSQIRRQSRTPKSPRTRKDFDGKIPGMESSNSPGWDEKGAKGRSAELDHSMRSLRSSNERRNSRSRWAECEESGKPMAEYSARPQRGTAQGLKPSSKEKPRGERMARRSTIANAVSNDEVGIPNCDTIKQKEREEPLQCRGRQLDDSQRRTERSFDRCRSRSRSRSRTDGTTTGRRLEGLSLVSHRPPALVANKSTEYLPTGLYGLATTQALSGDLTSGSESGSDQDRKSSRNVCLPQRKSLEELLPGVALPKTSKRLSSSASVHADSLQSQKERNYGSCSNSLPGDVRKAKSVGRGKDADGQLQKRRVVSKRSPSRREKSSTRSKGTKVSPEKRTPALNLERSGFSPRNSKSRPQDQTQLSTEVDRDLERPLRPPPLALDGTKQKSVGARTRRTLHI